MVAAAQHHGGSVGTTELSGRRRLVSLRRHPCNSSPQTSPPTVRPWTLPPALATTASASKSLMACSGHQDQRRSIIGIIVCCKNICAAKKAHVFYQIHSKIHASIHGGLHQIPVIFQGHAIEGEGSRL